MCSGQQDFHCTCSSYMCIWQENSDILEHFRMRQIIDFPFNRINANGEHGQQDPSKFQGREERGSQGLLVSGRECWIVPPRQPVPNAWDLLIFM